MQKRRLESEAQDPQHLPRSKPPQHAPTARLHIHNTLVDFSIFLEMCVDQLSRWSIWMPKYLTLVLNWIFSLKIQSFGEANLRFLVTSNASVFDALTPRELAWHHFYYKFDYQWECVIQQNPLRFELKSSWLDQTCQVSLWLHPHLPCSTRNPLKKVIFSFVSSVTSFPPIRLAHANFAPLKFSLVLKYFRQVLEQVFVHPG
mgnify:CR=1 FL=1